MGQTQSPTNLGYGELGKLVAGEGAGAVKSVVGLTGACTAAEASTFAKPGGATKLAANGFALVDADTVKSSKTTVDNDTVELDEVFTNITADQSVTGFAIENEEDDVVYAECCFAAAIPSEVDDTITVEMKMQFKKGA